MAGAIEAALARHRAVSVAGLILLVLLAWGWLLSGAGMAPGMAQPDAMDMPMQGHAMPAAPAMAGPAFAVVFAMWWIMMAAMMLPSAAPVMLLYIRVAAGSQVQPATASFLGGYLAAWGLFSLLAALLQLALERSGLLAAMTMTSTSRWLSAALFVAAGLYQLSPLKNLCLRHCRNPAQWLSAHYRPGRLGALRMGLAHGAWCVGCCWPLMLLLFAGGVMNIAWIAALSLMVAAEKLLPFGKYAARAAGIACLLWGLLLVVRA